MKKKRRLKRSIKIIFVLILCIISLYWIVTGSGKFDKILHIDRTNTINDAPSKDEKKEYELSLVMVGDALINDYLFEEANRQADYEGYDFKPFLTLIKDKVKYYDLAYYNQETILGGTSLGLSGWPEFNSPYEVGDAMIDAGFNLVSLATNHTMDKKEKGVLNSREYWNKQKDVYAFGSYSSSQEKEELESKIFTKNNIKYAILNYTYGLNGRDGAPYGKEYLVNVWSDAANYEKYKEQVISDIGKLRSKVDVLIVAMHWGVEYRHTPTDMQKKTAKFLADHGVDIVIGTHPHVIEPVEWINDTLVFYSLGNFISSQTSDSCTNYKCSIGLMSSLKITKKVDGDKSKITIGDVNNELIYTYHKDYRNYLVIPFSDSKIKDYLDDYKDVYDTYSEKIESDDERIKTVSLAS